MSKLKLKQVRSNMSFDENNNTLTVSGSTTDALIISGSVKVDNNPVLSGSLNIENVDTFGDQATPNSIDLGNY